MFALNPALEGKPPAADVSTGRTISSLAFEAVQSADEGMISYMFPKPGQTEATAESRRGGAVQALGHSGLYRCLYR